MFTQRKFDFADKKTQQYPMTLAAYIKDPLTPSNYYVTLLGLHNDLEAKCLLKFADRTRAHSVTPELMKVALTSVKNKKNICMVGLRYLLRAS